MKKYHRDGDLAPRDVVSRFSVVEMKKNHTKNVFLDMTHFEEDYLKKRFPSIWKECLNYKIDMSKKMIPVSPAAHYICGGIKTDEFGRTNVKNLYAIGECASTQIHGADRLASNSMTEGLVFSKRLIEKIKRETKRDKPSKVQTKGLKYNPLSNGRITKIRKILQELMWTNVGIIRNKKSLASVFEKVKKIDTKVKLLLEEGLNKELLELDNLVLLAKVIIFSSMRRKESRGTHFVQDYHERYDNIWMKHLTIDKNHPKFN